ncbi:MAG: TRAP transporter small permease subunit [Armatimonadota bacterium]|nr:TRAP transporter small permease subunit [Armatimonadota bacterium]
MRRVIRGIDRISETVGKAFAWLAVAMTLAMSFEVVSRYVFDRPTTWAFDASYMMYGAYFMMGSAYTLSRNAHVRGDIFYRNFTPRTQALIDLVLFIVVFFPAMTAFVVIGWDFFLHSFRIRETSPLSPYATPVWPLKGAIPAGAGLLLLQGVAQVLRCVIAIRTGQWPDHEEHGLEEAEALEPPEVSA